MRRTGFVVRCAATALVCAASASAVAASSAGGAAAVAFASPPSAHGVSGGAAAAAFSAASVGRSQGGSAFLGRGMRLVSFRPDASRRRGGGGGSTELKAFLGQDSGILGVGAPEVAVIVLVGYFILGPTDLYKLVKEIGKFIQNIRTLGVEASKSFENTMEDQLEIQELRKAQQELNDAFSFRRSINVEEDSYFQEGSAAETAAAATATATATAATAATATDETGAPKKRKMKRRRKKKKVEPAAEEVPPIPASGGNVPDLDMSDAFAPVKPEPAEAPVSPAPSPTPVTAPAAGSADWFEEQRAIPEQYAGTGTEDMTSPYEQDRFAAQLSGDWNQQILDNEDKLSPLSKVMERLAILEEEKKAADMRLEEEFRLKAELEEKFYESKRKVLEDAAAEVQASAYVSMAAEAEEEAKSESANNTEAKSSTV